MTRKRKLRIAVYGLLAAVVSLYLLHPFTRQTIFGPRIRGQPLWYWQNRYRESATSGNDNNSLTGKALALIGIHVRHSRPMAPHGDDMCPVLLSLVDDPDVDIRILVARHLGNHVESPQVCEALLVLTDDDSSAVRLHAVLSLARVTLTFEPALPKLRALIDDDASCRVPAAYALCSMQATEIDRNALTALQSALRANAEGSRMEAFKYLCLLGKKNPAFLDVVIECLPQVPSTMGPMAALYLADAGPAATGALVKLLSNNNDATRAAHRCHWQSWDRMPGKPCQPFPLRCAIRTGRSAN
jgi:HEAT repeat protein